MYRRGSDQQKPKSARVAKSARCRRNRRPTRAPPRTTGASSMARVSTNSPSRSGRGPKSAGIANGAAIRPTRWSCPRRYGDQSTVSAYRSRTASSCPVRRTRELTEDRSRKATSPSNAAYSVPKFQPRTPSPTTNAAAPSRVWGLRRTADARRRHSPPEELPAPAADSPSAPGGRPARFQASAQPKTRNGVRSAKTCQPKSGAAAVLTSNCRKRPSRTKSTIPWKTTRTTNRSGATSVPTRSMRWK